MTKQEIFDKVWNHFVVENNPPAMDTERRSCRYRTHDGLKCAVGILIPDKEYLPVIEQHIVTYLYMVFQEGRGYCPPTLAKLFREGNYNVGQFLHALQSAHDTYGVESYANDSKDAGDHKLAITKRVFEQYVATMREIAYKEGLTVPSETKERDDKARNF
jgi:hypothetical protein